MKNILITVRLAASLAAPLSRSLTRLALAAVAVFAVSAGDSPGQSKSDFEKPFVVCKTSLDGTSPVMLLASDNEILYIATKNSLIALNARTLLLEWATGFPESRKTPGLLFDSTLAFLSANDKTTTLHTVNKQTGLMRSSLSGLPFPKVMPVTLRRSSSGAWLLFDRSGRVALIEDDLSSMKWFRDFSVDLLDAEFTKDRIKLFFNDRALLVSLENGTNLEQVGFGDPAAVFERTADGSLIAGSSAGSVSFLKEETTAKKWSLKTGGRITSLQSVGDRILATSLDNFAYFIDTSSGALVWKKRLGARILYEPSIATDVVVISNSFDGTALFVDLSDGRTLNKINGPESASFTGEFKFIGNRLFVPSTKGLLVFSANGCQ